MTVGDKVYKRKTKAKGVLSYEAPIKPAAPRLRGIESRETQREMAGDGGEVTIEGEQGASNSASAALTVSRLVLLPESLTASSRRASSRFRLAGIRDLR